MVCDFYQGFKKLVLNYEELEQILQITAVKRL